MEINATKIPQCYEIISKVLRDKRGVFVKKFHQDIFKEYQLNLDFAEEYYSISHKDVLRGLHFQLPPMDHVKMVYCVLGSVLDVVVDLRVGSPTYRHYITFDLNSDKANTIYIPKGLAHGFCVTSEVAILVYKVSTVYDRKLDTGIVWPTQTPIVSDRDQGFQALSEFDSPFNYTEI